MNKRRYRTTNVNDVNWQVIEQCTDKEPVVFGVDVAKVDFVGALMTQDRSVIQTLKWRHPEQTRRLVEDLLKHLELGSLEVVMEPSGTYGDPVRSLFTNQESPSSG